MLEVECKYRLNNSTALLDQLHRWGATLQADHHEADHYLNAPDRDFAQTDEAFRLRTIGDRNFLTYKGPRRDSSSKTRPELEVPCPDGEDLARRYLQLFRHLGYRQTATVRKHRRIYELARGPFVVHFCIDSVEQVGEFVEIEVVAEESAVADALATIRQLAHDLGLTESVTRSYLEQLLGETVVPGGSHPQANVPLT